MAAAAGGPPPLMGGGDPTDITLANMFPMDIPMRKMQGGGTVRTWDIPPEAERLYYYIRTNGRPLKAKVELVSYSSSFTPTVPLRFVRSFVPHWSLPRSSSLLSSAVSSGSVRSVGSIR
jgi:hypothetical protein